MLSINMRIFKTVLLALALGTDVLCLPVAPETSSERSDALTTSSAPVTHNQLGDHYDQRQNGTENYRINVDGVIFVLAPVETLLLAGATDNVPDLSILGQNGFDIPKPGIADKPKPEVSEVSKPQVSPKSTNRPGLHLANFLLPLLRRIRHE